jgi:hypothetical protein
MSARSPYQGTTQDRINFAVSYIVQGRQTTRTFDTCFEMGDGDAVYAGIMRRAAKNPKLAANVGRYLVAPKVPA